MLGASLHYLTALTSAGLLISSTVMLPLASRAARAARHRPLRVRLAPVCYLLAASCALSVLLVPLSDSDRVWLVAIGACLCLSASNRQAQLDGMCERRPASSSGRYHWQLPGLYWFDDGRGARPALSDRPEVRLVTEFEPDRYGRLHGRVAREEEGDGRLGIALMRDCQIDESDEIIGGDELGVAVRTQLTLSCQFGDYEYSWPISSN